MLSPKILTFCIESLKYFEIINEKKELTNDLVIKFISKCVRLTAARMV